MLSALNWRRLLVTACLSLGCASLPAFAQPADSKPNRPDGQGQGRPDAGQFLQRARERLNELNLTDEQKKKVDEIYASGAEDLKKLRDLDPQERRPKMMELMTGLREKVAAVLTDEQKKKFAEMGPGGRGGPGGAGGVGARLEESLQKLDLTAEQKAKIKPVVEDVKKKFEELRSQIAGGGGDRQAMREKVMALLEETRDKLKEILTPEQATKLKELMMPPGGAGGGAGEGRRPGAGGGTPPPTPPAK